MGSLEESDKAAGAVAVAPRVTLDDIKSAIAEQYTFTLDKALSNKTRPISSARLDIVTVAVLIMKNGYIVIGKSAPASPDNFNAPLGEKFAVEDAMRQCWPLMAFSLLDKRGAAPVYEQQPVAYSPPNGGSVGQPGAGND